MAKKLVAYFSPEGETRRTAAKLAEIMKADLYEIRPEEPYTEADLDWTDAGSRTSLEVQDVSCRPALLEKTTDLSAYDIIFIGFPVWWDTAPKLILSFLESNDFSGKTVIPFGTSRGGGMGTSSADMKAVLPEGVNVTEGMLLNGVISQFKIETWLVSLGLPKE